MMFVMRRKAALALLLLLVAGSVVLVLARGDGQPPLSPPTSAPLGLGKPAAAGHAAAAGDAPGDTAPAGGNTATSEPAPSTPVRTAPTEPGLSGIVLDDLGAPIPNIVVYLRLVDSRLAGAEMACTDDDGCFLFRQAVGRCVLTVENDLMAPRELTMALGEWRFVELRATAPCLVVEGFVRQGDGPVAGRTVRVEGGPLRGVAVEFSDPNGHYRHVLPSGRYELSVASEASPADARLVEGSPTGPVRRPASTRFASHGLTLNAFTRHVRHDFELPSAALRVTVVHAGDRRPVPNVIVRATTGELGRYARTDAAGVAEMAEMASGLWRVWVVTTPQTSAAPATIEIDAAARAPRMVTLLVEPAGVVVLKPRAVGGATAAEGAMRVFGEMLLPMPGPILSGGLASQPRVVELHLAGGGVMSPMDPVEASAWMESTTDSLVFVSVPPGRHELRCEDRLGEGGCTYAAYEPFRQVVEVTAGATRTVDVTVPRRPWLEVVVAGADARIVKIPIQIVGARGPLAADAFLDRLGVRSGPVVPGDYRIVVEAPTGRVEATVTVGSRDVQHIVRLPSPAADTEKSASPR